MTHSTLVNEKRHATFNDLDLIALVSIAGAVARQHASTLPNASQLIEEWGKHLKNYGPGAIDLPFDTLNGSPALVEEFQALLQATEDQTQHFGSTIPGSVINKDCPAPSVRFGEFPTAALQSTIKALRALIAPKIP